MFLGLYILIYRLFAAVCTGTNGLFSELAALPLAFCIIDGGWALIGWVCLLITAATQVIVCDFLIKWPNIVRKFDIFYIVL